MTSFSKLYTMVGAAALLVGSGCGDLDVTNPNNPDVARALASADDVKSLAVSTMRSWYLTATAIHPHTMASVTADAGTANFGNFGMRFNNLEPRIAYENSSAGGDRDATEDPWEFNYSTLGAANDALRAFASGTSLATVAETNKYKALAQFTQAASLMNLALWFDKAFIVDETFDPNGPKLELVPFADVSAAALARFEALATFTTGSTAAYTSAEFPMIGGLSGARLNRMANTFAALTMAYTPRNAAQNGAVNWAKVATLAEKGIGTGSAGAPFDVVVQGDFTNWISGLAYYYNEPSWMRVDHRLINRMDGTTPPKFNGTVPPKGTSPDARYNSDFMYCQLSNPPATTGVSACQAPVIGDPGRGIYMQSVWAYKRYGGHARFTPGTNGRTAVPYILAAESDLIRAEALIRSGGSKLTAAALINNSRVGRGQLSILTGAESDAVLYAAIDYERDVELYSTNGFELQRARQDLAVRLPDGSGGGLQAGTVRHLPIPAKELETLVLPIYTFGGVGKEM